MTEVKLCRENPFDVLAIGDGVSCCEQSGAYCLVLHWSRYKGEWPVLSRCLASSTASASYLRPVWWLLYFSTGQHRCMKRVQLLTCETTDFIAPALWPANSPDLNPVDYQTWGKHRSRMHDVHQVVTPDRRVGTFPPGVHHWSHQAVASTSSSLHSRTRRTFWTQTLVMFDICTDVHFDKSVRVPIVDTFVWGDLTKPAITIASVDRF